MITCYTEKIVNGSISTGQDFLMLCVRALDIACSMREKPLSEPLPEKFEEDDYYVQSLKDAEVELVKYTNMSDDELQTEMDAEYKQAEQNADERAIKHQQEKLAYDKVRREVLRWQPPTEVHENLKKFALEQIDSCNRDYDPHAYLPQRVDLKTYRAEKIKDAAYVVIRHTERLQTMRESIDYKNKWLAELRASFN